MIQDPELREINEDMTQLSKGDKPAYPARYYEQRLMTSVATLARILDSLNRRFAIVTSDTANNLRQINDQLSDLDQRTQKTA